MNECKLGGNVSRIEVGDKVAKFTITTVKYKKNGENFEAIKTYHNCVAFGYTKDKVAKLTEGQWIVVDGEIEKNKHNDKVYVNIVVNRMHIPRDFNDSNENFNNQMKQQVKQDDEDSLDLPF